MATLTLPADTRPKLPFRVHFVDGAKLDIHAETADLARKAAEKRHIGKIDKVKLIKEQADD